MKILIPVNETESAAIRSKDGGGGDCEANPRSQHWTASEEENRYSFCERNHCVIGGSALAKISEIIKLVCK